jgi:hypothetical protein
VLVEQLALAPQQEEVKHRLVKLLGPKMILLIQYLMSVGSTTMLLIQHQRILVVKKLHRRLTVLDYQRFRDLKKSLDLKMSLQPQILKLLGLRTTHLIHHLTQSHLASQYCSALSYSSTVSWLLLPPHLTVRLRALPKDFF